MIYILTGVIAILSGLICYMEYQNRRERKSMLNAILAKNNQELVNLELADKTEIKAPEIDNVPEYVDTSAVPNDEYEKIITDSLQE